MLKIALILLLINHSLQCCDTSSQNRGIAFNQKKEDSPGCKNANIAKPVAGSIDTRDRIVLEKEFAKIKEELATESQGTNSKDTGNKSNKIKLTSIKLNSIETVSKEPSLFEQALKAQRALEIAVENQNKEPRTLTGAGTGAGAGTGTRAETLKKNFPMIPLTS